MIMGVCENDEAWESRFMQTSKSRFLYSLGSYISAVVRVKTDVCGHHSVLSVWLSFGGVAFARVVSGLFFG